MTRDELIAQLEYEHDGGMLNAFHEAEHAADLARLGRSFRRTQQWLHSWRQRYKAALMLPAGEINEPPGRVPLQQPAKPNPPPQPRPQLNGTGQHPTQKAK